MLSELRRLNRSIQPARHTGLSDFRQWFEQNRQLKPLGFYAVWGAMMANYGHLLQAEATYVLAQ